MKDYELTERGKLLICILLLILIIIIPGVIVYFGDWGGSPIHLDDPPQTVVILPNPQDDPEISDRPLPDGSGLNPLDPPEQELPQNGNGDVGNGNGEQGSFDPPQEEPHEEPKFGPVSINQAEGTMLFRFSLELQDSLDEDTIEMLGEFIASPRNTASAKILVEMPRMSVDDTTSVVSAVIEAFAIHGVARRTLIFNTLQLGADDNIIEIVLSFTLNVNQK